MRIRHRGFEPEIDASVFIAPTAVLAGRIKVGPGCRIMYGAVLDSEGSKIELDQCAIVCENAVLRATAFGDSDHPVVIGDHVFISPHATLLGCTIEGCSYIATGATVLQGAVVHSGAVVAVGALVHANSVVPNDFFVPPNSIAIGDPVEIHSPDEKESLSEKIKSIGFAKVAFGIDPQWQDQIERYRQVTEMRSKEFGHHKEDVILDDPEMKT